MIPFVFLGNAAWLDYVDTELTERGARVDLLGGFSDLLRWGPEGGLLSETEAQDLGTAALSAAGRAGLVGKRMHCAPSLGTPPTAWRKALRRATR
jgi:hypothetical protein